VTRFPSLCLSSTVPCFKSSALSTWTWRLMLQTTNITTNQASLKTNPHHNPRSSDLPKSWLIWATHCQVSIPMLSSYALISPVLTWWKPWLQELLGRHTRMAAMNLTSSAKMAILVDHRRWTYAQQVRAKSASTRIFMPAARYACHYSIPGEVAQQKTGTLNWALFCKYSWAHKLS